MSLDCGDPDIIHTCSGGGTGAGCPSSPVGFRNRRDSDSLKTDWPKESPRTICPPVFSTHTWKKKRKIGFGVFGVGVDGADVLRRVGDTFLYERS